jgi:hypothetical protein
MSKSSHLLLGPSQGAQGCTFESTWEIEGKEKGALGKRKVRFGDWVFLRHAGPRH